MTADQIMAMSYCKSKDTNSIPVYLMLGVPVFMSRWEGRGGRRGMRCF